MLFRSLAAASLLVVSVAADINSIIASLKKVDADLAQLNSSVVAFDGNLLLTIPILAASTQLSQDLDAGTKTAQQSANLSTNDAVSLLPVVQQLTVDAKITVDNLIAKKPQFAKLFLTGIIKSILQSEKSSADKYSAAIISKVPQALQAYAQTQVAPLDDDFNQAIAAYSN